LDISAGAVPVMAYDLSLMPNTSILTQLCGDAHVRNLGGLPLRMEGWSSASTTSTRPFVGPFEWM